MAKINFANLRRNSATALRSLGAILVQNEVCSDVGPLNAAADQCSRPSRYGERAWAYDIANLTFQMNTPKGTLPAKAKNFRVDLNISMAGHLDGEPDDPFIKLEINVEKYAQTSSGSNLKAAWHFDRHIIDKTTDGPYITDDIHPLYHFQFGGARMAQVVDQLGGTMLVEAPRLMHPPMDGILAIDFVLANYAGVIWKKLREDSRYCGLVVPQFSKLWKPYFDGVASSWINPRGINSGYLCPFVMS